MPVPTLEDALAKLLAEALGTPIEINSIEAVAGGSIHSAWAVSIAAPDGPARYFVKLGNAEKSAMLEAEADGLARLAATQTVRVPRVIHCAATHDREAHSALLLEWLELASLDAPAGRALGISLAALHRNTEKKFGLECDNFIGATPQVNRQENDWVRFWQYHRLLEQLRHAAENRFPARMVDRGERLVADCGAFFSAYQPLPSLLHGDLWGGNAGACANGEAVIFDPAVYYGDREADLAMTELFGGFPHDFYAAYRNVWPLDSGYETRKQLYNLYHVLNHANLFAGDYVRRSGHMIEALLAEI
jgi:protein-ribulosamine 3-kinase